jgi:Protein of unknown function (DUF4230)
MRRGITFKGLVAAFMVSIILLVPLGMIVAGVQLPRTPPPPPLPPLAVVRRVHKLVGTEAHLTTYIEGGNDHWETKVLVHGDLYFGIDLSTVIYTHVDYAKREASLRLPPPQLAMWKVDHDRSEEMFMRRKVWYATSDPQLVRAEVWKAADHKLERLGREEPSYTKEAKEQAEFVLRQLFEGVTWTIRFEWEDADAKTKEGWVSHRRGRADSPPGNATTDKAAGMTARVSSRG